MIRHASSSLRFCNAAALAASILTFTAAVQAQDASPTPGEPEGAITDMGEEDAVAEPQTEPAPEAAPAEEEGVEIDHEREPDGSTQLLMGVRYRAIITPKFLINMFGVDGGRTVVVHGVGPEIGGYFGKTADGFMVLVSPWYADYGLEQTPFKGKKDDDTAWEIIESDMKVWYLTVDAMWDHKLVERLSVDVGLGAGIGFLTKNGLLRRNEAFETPDGGQIDLRADKDWPNLSLCEGPGSLNNTGECPADGNYDIKQGGSSDRWPVYPWLNFQMGLRYQPIDEFVGRLDLGLGSSGFWLGLGADYSLFL